MNRLLCYCGALLGRLRFGPAVVTDYPLTREEVRLLARHWMEVYLNSASFCVRNPAAGTLEEAAREHATARLGFARAALGGAEFQAVSEEAQSRVLEQLAQGSMSAAGADEPLWCEDDY